jgi:hypothetical protein
MVQFCASLVTSADPVFSPREIDNATLWLLLAIARIADEAMIASGLPDAHDRIMVPSLRPLHHGPSFCNQRSNWETLPTWIIVTTGCKATKRPDADCGGPCWSAV